jgi:hypothetical protein
MTGPYVCEHEEGGRRCDRDALPGTWFCMTHQPVLHERFQDDATPVPLSQAEYEMVFERGVIER